MSRMYMTAEFAFDSEITKLAIRTSKASQLMNWKFGENRNKYFCHAIGQLYAISRELISYISHNQQVGMLRWVLFIGLGYTKSVVTLKLLPHLTLILVLEKLQIVNERHKQGTYV
ncbi:hypothetical protein YC2023_113190 [Brassica napus]